MISLELEKKIEKIYGSDTEIIGYQLERYQRITNKLIDEYGLDEYFLFSVPGRAEISGNHTDHNLGKVIAASVNLDSIAAVSKNDTDKISVVSEGFGTCTLDFSELAVIESERESTISIIRGIAARFKKLGYEIGGFNAVITSDVLPGSGLSSSASFEILIGTIFNHLFNNGKIGYEVLAQIGQYAENHYFGKPCGLMDQVACAAGGIVSIDFELSDQPLIEELDFDFNKTDHSLLVVDTGCSHDDLTHEYASIPIEMKQVAKVFGKDFLRQVSEEEFYRSINLLRENLGDRAILRAIHFFEENKRVVQQVSSLLKNDFSQFLKYVNDSGNSSFKYLQNIFVPSKNNEQGVSLAICITDSYLQSIKSGAARVHGGGFAGTILVILPKENVNDYCEKVSHVLGKDKVKVLSIRKFGSVCLDKI